MEPTETLPSHHGRMLNLGPTERLPSHHGRMLNLGKTGRPVLLKPWVQRGSEAVGKAVTIRWEMTMEPTERLSPYVGR